VNELTTTARLFQYVQCKLFLAIFLDKGKFQRFSKLLAFVSNTRVLWKHTSWMWSQRLFQIPTKCWILKCLWQSSRSMYKAD